MARWFGGENNWTSEPRGGGRSATEEDFDESMYDEEDPYTTRPKSRPNSTKKKGDHRWRGRG